MGTTRGARRSSPIAARPDANATTSKDPHPDAHRTEVLVFRFSRSLNRSLIELAVRQTVETLEPRTMMSVSHDANGFTVVTPESDSRVVYVSSSGGSDSNSGL